MADTPRVTLRDLTLPARLVLSAFLLTVGLGYLSAMVQLHMKHSDRDGEALPTADNLVARFSGLEKPNSASAPCSKIDSLISGDATAPDVSKENMAPAFFAKSKGWEAAQARNRGASSILMAERENERKAMLAWVRSEAAAKKAAYEADRFTRPDSLKGKPFTTAFADGEVVKIRTLINERCAKCHADQGEVSLGSYANLEPLTTPPSQELIDGKWVRSSKQISVEALTQSTHAHLLSFAVLFTLTGLTFAFTSYPGSLRGALGPIVLIAQVADIACWWLARVPNYGPFFAYTIIGTGSVVGIGLSLQIVLSLFNMYGPKGKAVLFLLLLGGGASVGFVGLKVIQPALDEERKPKDAPPTLAAKPGPPKVALAEPSQLEKLIMGPSKQGEGAPFNGNGTMAPAFFEKDSGSFKKLEQKRPEVRDEREGERNALLAWLRSDAAKRKAAYETDAFPLPAELNGKPITPDYVEGKVVKVKTLLEDRCVRCHSKDGEQSDFPLETYDELLKYIDGKPKDEKGIPKAED
jgi:hypothetical protein